MKAAKGTINEALAQVANHNKELRPVVEATEGNTLWWTSYIRRKSSTT
jgi:hypothetical protein